MAHLPFRSLRIFTKAGKPAYVLSYTYHKVEPRRTCVSTIQTVYLLYIMYMTNMGVTSVVTTL